MTKLLPHSLLKLTLSEIRFSSFFTLLLNDTALNQKRTLAVAAKLIGILDTGSNMFNLLFNVVWPIEIEKFFVKYSESSALDKFRWHQI